MTANDSVKWVFQKPPVKPKVVRVITKKQGYKEKFYGVVDVNLKIVDELIRAIAKVSKSGNYTEAEELIGITRVILENNKELQTVVNDVLQELK